jgi:hypothetical protein
MGVLVDYFAADADQAAQLDLIMGPNHLDVPYVDCKGWLDGLESLASELTGRDGSEFARPKALFEDSMEYEGPGLYQVDAEVVAALASVDDERLTGYADDELLDDHEIDRQRKLRDLAREAVERKADVYCWLCV